MARTATFDRQEILTRARDLFWRKGYHATSLKDLEQVLELKPGSIYAAFGSKEKLFAEALTDYAAASKAEAEAEMGTEASPIASLAAYARSLGRLCDREVPSRACMLMKTVLEFPDDASDVRRAAEALLKDAEARFVARFEQAQEAGELTPAANTQRLGRRFQADIIGLRAYAQRNPEPGALKDLAEDIAQGVEALRV